MFPAISSRSLQVFKHSLSPEATERLHERLQKKKTKFFASIAELQTKSERLREMSET